jgi:hypothetical protein
MNVPIAGSPSQSYLKQNPLPSQLTMHSKNIHLPVTIGQLNEAAHRKEEIQGELRLISSVSFYVCIHQA